MHVTTLSAFGQSPLSTQRAFLGVGLSSPVFLTHSGDGTNRIFVLEQDGRIKVFPNDPSTAAGRVRVFLDLTSRLSRFHNEAGLLGLAFHPNYRENGHLYVYYTRGNPNRSAVSRFTADPADPDRADLESELEILEVMQPFGNHNAGMMQFGPADGYLYISLGDGGDRRDGRLFPPDSLGNGQNLETHHSAILRIDVDHPSDGMNYGIPADNPFAGNPEGSREEIWAYGLRNPWRFSIDSLTNQLWVADVGAKAWEEVNLVEKGDNFGWSVMEGTDCFREAGCGSERFKPPLVQRPHVGGCNSITGGYVYRGSRRPELQGAYIYGDYCHGYLRMIRFEDGEVIEEAHLLNTSLRISSFGVDEQNELYIVNHNGNLFQFSPASTTDAEQSVDVPRSFALDQNHPNPFTPPTTIQYELQRAGEVELQIFDVLGRKVRSLANGIRPAGRYEIVWDGSNDAGAKVAGGLYLLRMQLDGRSLTRVMTLNQ